MYIVLCNGTPQEFTTQGQRVPRGRKATPLLADAFDRITVFATEEEAHTAIGRTLCYRIRETPARRVNANHYEFWVTPLVAHEENATR